MNNNLNRFISYFFFSNIFLGFTAVALCIETNLLSGLSLNYFPFYIVIFLGTCLYYTMIYVHNIKVINYNERTIWYRRNLPAIIITLKYIIAGILFFALIIVFRNRHRLFSLSALQWLLMAVFPLTAGWYTFSLRIFKIKNIRELGMVKPFIIGLTWSGFVTVYPVFTWQIQKDLAGNPPLFPSFYLWLQNFLYISILAIIFDIKDHDSDLLHHLNTFPVKLGIKNTMHRVAFPLLVITIIVFSAFCLHQRFQAYQVALQSIPYLLLLTVVFKQHYPKRLLYYLAGIDGLMLLKAFCGIAATLF